MVDSAFAAKAITCREAVQMGINMQKEKYLLTVVFKTIRFDFIPRSANSLAHILATEMLKRKEESYLIGGVPYYAESQARNESLREPD
ncbi:protein QUIRKY-like [Gossypium australe]|uniref:Protein QUIRKY-like n=1 Tax=Gossypium australe TaxID=47621 RepID=A0A5B6VC76_9ROSI|nr:protein QUIRKY-like [Gossypium australe]